MVEDYWVRNYGDYFKVGSNKDLVKKEDGQWELRTPETPESKIVKSLFGNKK